MFQKSDKKIISILYASKCPNTSILHKALLSKSRFYFLFSHPLTRKNSTIYWDDTLLVSML